MRAFILLPDHTCLRAARRQVQDVWICDVKVVEWVGLNVSEAQHQTVYGTQ